MEDAKFGREEHEKALCQVWSHQEPYLQAEGTSMTLHAEVVSTLKHEGPSTKRELMLKMRRSMVRIETTLADLEELRLVWSSNGKWIAI